MNDCDSWSDITIPEYSGRIIHELRVSYRDSYRCDMNDALRRRKKCFSRGVKRSPQDQ